MSILSVRHLKVSTVLSVRPICQCSAGAFSRSHLLTVSDTMAPPKVISRSGTILSRPNFPTLHNAASIFLIPTLTFARGSAATATFPFPTRRINPRLSLSFGAIHPPSTSTFLQASILREISFRASSDSDIRDAARLMIL